LALDHHLPRDDYDDANSHSSDNNRHVTGSIR
jgi:hypothetical protein